MSKSNKIINPLISKRSIELLQFRLHEEEMSVRLYYAMSVWLNSKGYMNASKLWKHYSDDEIEHVNKVSTYLLALNVKPEVSSLEQPKNDYTSLVEVVKDTYTFMLKISGELQELAKHAAEENDFMLLELAQWYLKEQIPGYDDYQTWLDQIETFGGSTKIELRLLDIAMGDKLKELGK